jgi:hypothetical protein
MGEKSLLCYHCFSDIDIMFSDALPNLNVPIYYRIPFDTYAICYVHPVTTELPNEASCESFLFVATLLETP